MPHVSDVVDPGYDLDTLMRAKEIEKDPARMSRAREHALREKERFTLLADEIPGRPPKTFNGAARGSGMRPK